MSNIGGNVRITDGVRWDVDAGSKGAKIITIKFYCYYFKKCWFMMVINEDNKYHKNEFV